MKSKETPTNGSKKQNQNKLRSQIENIVVKAIMKYNEHGKISNSCFLKLKQIIVLKIILFIVLNVDLYNSCTLQSKRIIVLNMILLIVLNIDL